MSLADFDQLGGFDAGVPSEWLTTIWPGFEKGAIDLVCQACERLKTDSSRGEHWRERHFSFRMWRHLEKLCLERNLPYSPRYDQPLLSDEEFERGANPQASPLLDLVIRLHKDVPTIYFGLEAKILVDQMVGSYAPGKTIEEYVTEGMQRYVTGKYGNELPTAAMIGYVLAGDPADLSAKINAEIKAKCLPYDQLLAQDTHTPPPDAFYSSRHPRNASQAINLHHLFICFKPVVTKA